MNNVFVALWRGDVPLVQTYWLWGALVVFLFKLPLLWTEDSLTNVETVSLTYSGFLVGYSLVVIFYGFFISVAIWRSAGKYPGPRKWYYLARIASFYSFLSSIKSLAELLGAEMSS